MKAKKIITATQAKMPEMDNDDWMDWMERWGATLKPIAKEALWGVFVDRWQKLWTPKSDLKTVETFLNKFATPDAYKKRLAAGWGTEFASIWQAVFEPVTMALGVPEYPWPVAWPHIGKGEPAPTQGDFDRRLANWLRLVIYDKDIASLKYLVTFLESTPHLDFGFQPEVVFNHLLENGTKFKRLPSRQNNVLFEYFKYVERNRRLPFKIELRKACGLIGEEHKTNFSAYLKTLGLAGLPQQPKTTDRFVTKSKRPIRTH